MLTPLSPVVGQHVSINATRATSVLAAKPRPRYNQPVQQAPIPPRGTLPALRARATITQLVLQVQRVCRAQRLFQQPTVIISLFVLEQASGPCSNARIRHEVHWIFTVALIWIDRE